MSFTNIMANTLNKTLTAKFLKMTFCDFSGIKIYLANSLHFSLQKVEPHSPPLKCWLYLVTYF